MYPRKRLCMTHGVLSAADSEWRMKRVCRESEGLKNFPVGGGRQHSSVIWKKLQGPTEHPFEVSDHESKVKQVNIACFTFFDPPQPVYIQLFMCHSERNHEEGDFLIP